MINNKNCNFFFFHYKTIDLDYLDSLQLQQHNYIW